MKSLLRLEYGPKSRKNWTQVDQVRSVSVTGVTLPIAPESERHHGKKKKWRAFPPSFAYFKITVEIVEGLSQRIFWGAKLLSSLFPWLSPLRTNLTSGRSPKSHMSVCMGNINKECVFQTKTYFKDISYQYSRKKQIVAWSLSFFLKSRFQRGFVWLLIWNGLSMLENGEQLVQLHWAAENRNMTISRNGGSRPSDNRGGGLKKSFGPSSLSLREHPVFSASPTVIFRRNESDDRKYVCCSQATRASLWSKNKGEAQAPWAPPLDPPLSRKP